MSQTIESGQPSDRVPEHSPSAGPVTESERIIALDVLRGFALFGILMVNMAFFAMPFMRGIFDPSLVDAPYSEQAASLFVKLFFEYKFVSLFSLLFGIGFAVQLSRAMRRNAPFLPVYLRRLSILMLIGLTHAVMLWFGDILLFYSIIAIVLLVVRNFKARTLLLLAATALFIGTVLMVLTNSAQFLMMQASASEMEQVYMQAEELIASGEAPSGFSAIRQAQFDPFNPLWQDAELRAYRDGPFIDAFAFRLISYIFAGISAAFGFGWHILAMFLLGMALMKANFFSSDRRAWHQRLAMFALPIGLALEAVFLYYYATGGYNMSLGMILAWPLHELGSVLLMLGYVGVICLIVQSGALKWLTDAIAAAGRMALTVYLSQTIIATGIMYWWGLGWFGSVSRTEMIGLVIVIYAALVIFSVLWLNAFRFGPMEWLWRVMTYLKLQPIRRST